MSTVRKFGLSTLAAAVALLAPLALQAQSSLSIDARAGIAVPVTDNLSDLVDSSPTFNFGVNLGLTDRIGVRAEAGADIFEGADIDEGIGFGEQAPDLTFTRFSLGPVYQLLDPEASQLTIGVNAGGGASIITSDRRTYSGADFGILIIDISQVEPLLNAGVDLGYRISESVEFFVSGQAYFTIAKDTDDNMLKLGMLGSCGLASQCAEDSTAPPRETRDSFISLPITGGFRFHF